MGVNELYHWGDMDSLKDDKGTLLYGWSAMLAIMEEFIGWEAASDHGRVHRMGSFHNERNRFPYYRTQADKK